MFGKNWAILCYLTIITKYKHFNGLTPPAAKPPAFPSAKRYGQTNLICKRLQYPIANMFIFPNTSSTQKKQHKTCRNNFFTPMKVHRDCFWLKKGHSYS